MPKKVPSALLTLASVLTTVTASAQAGPPTSSDVAPTKASDLAGAPATPPPSSSASEQAALLPKGEDRTKAELPPISLATREAEAAATPSWFARAPLTVSVGEGDQRWQATIYGFIEADAINDSTRSYVDSIGSSLVARNEYIEGQRGRTQFSIRNTRLGFALASPVVGKLKPTAVLETDFFGNQPNPPTTSEAVYFNSPTLRLRQAYLKLEDPYIDILVGQTYYLFGWQNYFFPSTLEFLGLPNQAFGRTAQVRFTHTFETHAVNVDLAVAALRPAQADSEIPDGNAGLRFSVNQWKGISTPGNGGTAAFPMSIGVSGTVREFRVNAFTPPPALTTNRATGEGLSVDALLPLIPARNADDRGNSLTITGSFVIGTGIADLVGAGGGASFPTLPNPAFASPPPNYTPDIDNGIVTFDNAGVLHTIDWQTFMVGLQYYLPPTGRVFIAANYTQGYSKNMSVLYPRGGAEINLETKVANMSRYADANLFFDATPAVRFGGSFQYTATQYIDGETPRNLRWMAQALYFF
jgi:hypothetical protein